MKTKRHLPLIIVIMTTLLIGAATQAFPYAWWEFMGTPWHWHSGGTTMYLHPVSFVSGSSWTNNMTGATQDWTNVIASPLTYSWTIQSRDINNHGDGYNAVAFVRNGCEWSGIAYVRTYFLSAHLKDTDIWFDADCQGWVPSNPTMEENVFAQGLSFRNVAQHELGHALGLNHEFSTVSIMNYGALVYERLQGDDKNGIRFLYPGSGIDTDISVTNAASDGGYQRYVNSPFPRQVMPGGTIQIEYTIQNMGTVALNSVSVGFYLGDHLLGRSYFNFPVHSIGTFTRALAVPSDVSPGSYPFYVFIDDTNSFTESDELNNRFQNPWGPVNVYLPPGAPGQPVATPPNPEYGPFTISWESSSSGGRPISYYLFFHEYTLTIGNVTGTHVIVINVTGNSFNLEHLPVTTHIFWVKAVDDLGNESNFSPSTQVNVTSENLAPIFDPIGNKFVYAGDTLRFPIRAGDPEGDAVSYSASNLPPGSTFSYETFLGRQYWYFTWTPTSSQIGTHDVTITATDNFGASHSETIRIDVVSGGSGGGGGGHLPPPEPMPLMIE